MAENVSHSKIKKRKAFVSDSEDDEVLKKHKTVDSDEPTEREVDSCGEISTKCTVGSTVGSQQSTEEKENGEYEYENSVENGLTDSESAGTDVEPTTDDESPQPNRRPKKKRKISIKSERRSRNNLQVGSSSESEDEGPLSPKSPPSSKKSFRRRRTISGGKAPSKKSSDSESYKTDSESDDEYKNREPTKDSAVSHTKIRGKERRSKSQAAKETSRAEKKVEKGTSDSNDDVPLQKPKHHSSSKRAEGKDEQVSSKKNECEGTAESKKVIDGDTGSSSDRCSDSAEPQKREEKAGSVKRDSSSDEGKVKTHSETTADSEVETTRNTGVVKRECSSGDSDSEPLIKAKANKELQPKTKKIKREESSNDSGSDSSCAEETAKDAEYRGRSESPLNRAKNKKLHNDSDSSSSKEGTKKKKRQKNKLPDEDKRIMSLKKYLKIAGIRIHNYSDLWKDCRSNKARAQKLLLLLEENGLKGRPTIEKCKKLRKKIETRREVEELDLANVMEFAGGRTRRSRQNTSVSQELPNETLQTSSDIRKRLRVLADSDSSESN